MFNWNFQSGQVGIDNYQKSLSGNDMDLFWNTSNK